MKCKNCNGTLRATSLFCPNCGAKVEKEEVKEEKINTEEKIKDEKKEEAPKTTTNNAPSNEESTIGWGILGFFIPLVGIILFFVWLNDKPKASKSAGLGALIRIVFTILIIIFIFVYFFINVSYYVTSPRPSRYNNYYDDYDYNYNYNYNNDIYDDWD